MRTLLLLTLVSLHYVLCAQNLVRNPGFETLARCPKKLGELAAAEGWSSPNGGDPDLFSACFEGVSSGPGVPLNRYGNQPPMEGSAYAGLGRWPEMDEYLQGVLTQSLEAGKDYVLRFRLARLQYSKQPMAQPIVAFTQGRRSSKDPHGKDPNWQFQAAVRVDSLLAGGWDIWTLPYRATGGEDHLVLGLANGQADPTFKCHYFLDYFELYPCLPGVDCSADYYTGTPDPEPENLVPNGGFEQHVDCPAQREDLRVARAWRIAAYTPDCYMVCGTGTAAVPVNEMGTQWPHGGEAYGGFWAYVIPGNDYREFLSIQLKDSLQRGQRYQVSLWLSLAEVSNVALCGLKVRASAHLPANPRVAPAPGEFAVDMEADGVLQDRNGWQPLRATFTAQGGERYLTIGNYRQEADDCLIEIGGNSLRYKAAQKAAYYYVDDVRLTALPTPPPVPTLPSVSPPRWRSGDTLRLNDVVFAFDKAEISVMARPGLDSLSAFLLAHPDHQIDITGHTDSEGDASYNWRLSQRRAEAIRAYLIGQDIPAAQVSAGGLGESRPIAPNDSPQGRERNRRVEVVFFKVE